MLQSEEVLADDSPTDELPVLPEIDVVDDDGLAVSGYSALDPDETGRHPLLATEPSSDRLSSTQRLRVLDAALERVPAAFQNGHGDGRVGELTRRLAQLEVRLEDKDDQIASLGERLRATRVAVARRDDTERRLQEQLAESQARQQELEAQLAEAHTTRDELESRLREAERLAADYAGQVAEMRSRLRTLELAAKQRDTAYTELESELIAREAHLVERERRLSEAEKWLAGGRSPHAEPDGWSAPSPDSEAAPRRAEPDARAPWTSDPAGAPWLVCLTSDPPQEHSLRGPIVIIGRGPSCDIRIATHFVSREHARIQRERDAVILEDLGSKNGVFVNAVRVERETLRDGDLVTIGETQFRFHAG